MTQKTINFLKMKFFLKNQKRNKRQTKLKFPIVITIRV